MGSREIKKIFTVVMSVILVFTMMPVNVFAETVADASIASETSGNDGRFERSENVGDMVITVRAALCRGRSIFITDHTQALG